LPGFPEYKYENAATDSAWGSWPMDFSEAQNGGDLVIVSHVRHPSGLLVIRLDTAIRVAGQTAAGPMYADSVVVPGLEHGEYLGFYCALPDGSGGEYVAGSCTTRIRSFVRDWRGRSTGEPFESSATRLIQSNVG
jgi:hypothetical protein